MTDKNIAIAYHSGYGHTAKIAEAIAKGANEISGVRAELIKVDVITDAQWEALDNADAIVFGAPTYMGGVSAQFKTFADATAKRWFALKWKDKLAAGFTNSGSYSGDKLSSLQYLSILAMQHQMLWVGVGENAPQLKGTSQPSIDDVNRIGSWLGLMAQSNNESPEIQPPSGDIATAVLFGKRIAQTALRLK
jgi:NAD(P)H dehydrogenase (quinone)